MCGIFGIAVRANASFGRAQFESLLGRLYLLSESRGKESSGLHLHLPGGADAWTIKDAKSASDLLSSAKFSKTLATALDAVYRDGDEVCGRSLIAVAHSRLVTNGRAEFAENNQPVRWGEVTVIHNGIVVNVDDLWARHPHLARHAEVDSEILAALFADAIKNGANVELANRRGFESIEGAASVAWVHAGTSSLSLATNTGDLYFAMLPDDLGLVFASERFILETSLKQLKVPESLHVRHVSAGTALSYDVQRAIPATAFPLFGEAAPNPQGACELHQGVRQNDILSQPAAPSTPIVRAADESLLRYSEQSMRQIRRCSCCVLPHTFPFIAFDDEGVCNYCRNYKPKYKHVDALEAQRAFIASLQGYRSADGSPDVLVPFSGGRDSCYGLDLIKREFGLNPITFTYDWGMVTDLARRNIARLCGKLGVQNILVSADIRAKRDNIRKNVAAWLRKPDLGMVPLFMAGDKHFFKIVNDLKRQTGIRLDLWSANPLENTDFKSGLCGIEPDFDKHRVDYLSMGRKARLALYYASRFASNPRYINGSIPDTLTSFLSYYVEPRRDFFFMFNHMVWNEEVVNRTLIDGYDWETSPDSPSTWRIGDGTAPFYNYIYMTARGFTEFDTFRSNQIREGQISRTAALAAIIEENRPRTATLRWYLETIGIDFDDAVREINKLDTLGLHA